MITRKIYSISDVRLKPTIDIIQVDPHDRFVCTCLPDHHSIYFIVTNQFSRSLKKGFLKYAETHSYTKKLAVEAAAKIDTSKNNVYNVELIRIGRIWQQKQFMAFTTIQNVQIFQVFCHQEKIKVQAHHIVGINNESPITGLRFHYSAVYLGRFNRQMQVYELNDKNIWTESESILKMDKEFLRIAIYDTDLEDYATNIQTVIEKENQQKEVKQSKQIKGFVQLESLSLLQCRYGIKHYPIEKLPDLQPRTPVIIYQENNNALKIAQYDFIEEQYVSQQICPPHQYLTAPIYEDSQSEEWQQQQEMNSRSEMKRKKNKSKPKKKSQVKNEQLEESLIITDPLMYKMTNCEKFIIHDNQSSYSIFSREQNWQSIYTDAREPIINPFYQLIEERVYLEIGIRTGKQILEDVIDFIQENYEIVLVAFPTPRPFGKVEVAVLKLELLIVDKLGKDRIENQGKSLVKDSCLKEAGLIGLFNWEDQDQKYKKNKIQRFIGGQEDEQFLDEFNMYKQEFSQQQQFEQIFQKKYVKKQDRNEQNKKRAEKAKTSNKQHRYLRYDKFKNIDPPKPTTNTLHPHTFTFQLGELNYLKEDPLRMEWISENEILFTTQQKNIYYFHVSPNFIYPLIAEVYIYLFWYNYRDYQDFWVQKQLQTVLIRVKQENKQLKAKMESNKDDQDSDVEI